MKKIETIIRKCLECPWRRYATPDRSVKGCGYGGSIKPVDSWEEIPASCELDDANIPVEDIVEPGC